ncbi:uncharacterized protein LOC108606312 isoform X1 [Drosophila busckii]|uniref:uncharacterized protein LOC108606312 isoform X1 n=1 Tax=Drosophila busckii TaxID=30019 RepID=UPI001432E12C|nr:uncharacterized protein LOC108606312 isoform X1 [Drosophila busckii]
MATTATKAAAAAVAAEPGAPSSSSSNNNNNSSSSSNNNTNNNNNNNIISAPIKIPLSERFSTQTSTGSADSGVIVTSASQKQLCSGGSQTTLLQLQQLPVRSSSVSLSQQGPLPKWRQQQQQQRQQQQQQQQQQQLLLSQDSGIEQRGGGSGNAGSVGAGQSNSSSESLGSSGVGQQTRAASALELSSVGVGSSNIAAGNALRRIKYKSTNSTGTQGFDVEDRIEEVDIADMDDDDEEEEVDDGVAVDVDEEDNQSGIIINIGSHTDESSSQLKSSWPLPTVLEQLPLELAPLTVAAAAAKKRDIRSLGTDGHIYFPLLKINEDPNIDAKLINRKDGLQDTMYYLDEFGSPKLREKFARKQKQRQAKQQKALLKREREDQRKKRNTTVASNLAASGLDTKEQTTATANCDNYLTLNKPSSTQQQDSQDDTGAGGGDRVVKMRVRSHSHDNHYDRRHSDDRQDAGYVAGDDDEDDDVDLELEGDEIETGAEATQDNTDCCENVKTAHKLARTQSCVSWTKVVQKFKHILGRDGSKITTVVATPGQGTDRVQEVSYTDTKVIGNGSFGVVFQAKLCDTGERVAIKKVLQDRRFKNRELQIMRRLEHCNIVKLLYFFYSSGEKRDEVFLNLVLEYIPETVYKVARQYARTKQTIPINFIRLYMYQLFRSLAYIHSLGICHRDIKPQNLLLDPESAVLKLCDFGSAKQLLHGEPNVSYICSRYYRAPELIFGAINYTTKIDVWSAGCVLAELLLGQPIFPGDSGVDQLVEVIKVLGTPTREQIREMNPNYTEFKFPQIKSHPWQKVFRIRTPQEAINLVSQLLEYTPSARITPLKACAHPFFDDLRQEVNQKLPNGRDLPPLFNFTEHELSIQPSLVPQLLPKHLQNAANTAAVNRASAGGAATTAAASGSTSVSSTGSGTSAEGVAQSQSQANAAAATAAGAAGAAAATAAGTAASGAAAGGASAAVQGNNSNNSSSGGSASAAPTAASTANNAQSANASAAAGAANAGGANATSNAGGNNITGSQSNSALNNSADGDAKAAAVSDDGGGSAGNGSAGSGNGSGENNGDAGAAAAAAAAEAEQTAASASG